jgi:class 3 adenylate cyclase
MKLRLIFLLTALGVASCAALFALQALAPDQRLAIQVLIGAANTFICAAWGWALSEARSRLPERRAALAVGSVLAGALVLGALVLYWVWSPPELVAGVPIGLPIAVVGNALFLVGLFYAAGDALARLTRNARSVRLRLIVFGLLCGGVAVLLDRTRFTGGGDSFLPQVIALLIIAIIVSALANVVSARLTERLSTVVEGLRSVSRGRLDGALDERGRDELAELAGAFNAMTAGLRERALLERAFGQYVAPEVLETIRRRGSLQLGAERREVSVLFADVRGFTAMSEAHAPEEIVQVLDAYLERVIEVVARHGGFLNKFIGDAVMVVFNAPLDQPDHAARAVACALDLQQEVQSLNERQAFGEGRVLQVGVGVNTGPAVAGTLGSAHRAEYTVIGDTVNIASRLTNAASAGEVLIGAATARGAGRTGLDPLPPLTVKGKAQALEVYRVPAACAA